VCLILGVSDHVDGSLSSNHNRADPSHSGVSAQCSCINEISIHPEPSDQPVLQSDTAIKFSSSCTSTPERLLSAVPVVSDFPQQQAAAAHCHDASVQLAAAGTVRVDTSTYVKVHVQIVLICVYRLYVIEYVVQNSQVTVQQLTLWVQHWFSYDNLVLTLIDHKSRVLRMLGQKMKGFRCNEGKFKTHAVELKFVVWCTVSGLRVTWCIRQRSSQ